MTRPDARPLSETRTVDRETLAAAIETALAKTGYVLVHEASGYAGTAPALRDAILAALPTLSTTDTEGLRREIEALRVTPPYTGKNTINYNRAIDDVLALLAASSPTLPELPE